MRSDHEFYGVIDGALLIEIFDDRLDDDVACLQVRCVGGAGDIRERLHADVFRDFSLGDAIGKEFINPCQPRLQKAIVHFTNDCLVACTGRDLRNP